MREITPRQRNLLAHVAAEGPLGTAEGYAFDELYYVNPPIRWQGMRTVARALERRGLLTIGEWVDERAGCVLRATPAGLDALNVGGGS